MLIKNDSKSIFQVRHRQRLGGLPEEEAEGEEQLSLLNSEANNDLPEDIKDGKYKSV